MNQQMLFLILAGVAIIATICTFVLQNHIDRENEKTRRMIFFLSNMMLTKEEMKEVYDKLMKNEFVNTTKEN